MEHATSRERRRSPALLVIEDNDVDATLVERLLRRIDPAVEMIRVRDGEEALAAIQADVTGTHEFPRPLVTLVDINMPRMTGLELLDRLKANDYRSPGAPIFVLTTSSHPEDRRTALAHPCVTDYLVKPLRRETLERVLATALD